MQAVSLVLVSLLAVVVGGYLARAIRVPLPFVLIVLGMLLHGLSPVPLVLDPALFFLLFLPPLLFLDGWRIPSDELVREAGSIARLALGLVLVTVLGVGWFIHLMLPVVPLPVALALAAVISPTDPTALSSIASRQRVPQRLLRILQGEALFNDASGLVCMQVALGVAMTGVFSLPQAVGSFVIEAVGGLAIGAGLTWAVARVMAAATRRLGDDGGAPVLVTLLLPFAVYLLAERWHCSGILAAVAAGLSISADRQWPWRAETRLRRTAVWDVMHLAVNGSIFVLLGSQIPPLLASAPRIALDSGFGGTAWLAAAVVAIVLALGLLRLAWVWLSLSGPALVRRVRRRADAAGPVPVPTALVLAATLGGVRGAVTLAGVMSLPQQLPDGSPFPARDLVVLLAAGVIIATLALATVALPLALRRLPAEADDDGVSPAREAEDAARTAAARAAMQAIRQAARKQMNAGADVRRSTHVRNRLLNLYRQRIDRHASELSASTRQGDDSIERGLRLAALRAERDSLEARSRDGTLDDETRRRLLHELDLQEARHRG